MQPNYAGPGDLEGKLQGLPLLQTVGNRTFDPQFKPIIVPPPLVKPADFYMPRNSPKKYSCEVHMFLIESLKDGHLLLHCMPACHELAQIRLGHV